MKTNQSEEQSDFRAGRSTLDNVFTVKIATEKRVQHNRESYIALIDLENVYESVPISQLWMKTENLEINENLIRATKIYYKQITTRNKRGNKLTLPFETTTCFRPGCCLSPTLFKIYLDRLQDQDGQGIVKSWD